jgi:hypothetical protein
MSFDDDNNPWSRDDAPVSISGRVEGPSLAPRGAPGAVPSAQPFLNVITGATAGDDEAAILRGQKLAFIRWGRRELLVRAAQGSLEGSAATVGGIALLAGCRWIAMRAGIAAALGVGGGILVAVGGVLWLLRPRPEPEPTIGAAAPVKALPSVSAAPSSGASDYLMGSDVIGVFA